MKTATERFKIGDRVRLSEDGREVYPALARAGKGVGVVAAFPRNTTTHPWKMRVKLDTARESRTFHVRYWELDA